MTLFILVIIGLVLYFIYGFFKGLWFIIDSIVADEYVFVVYLLVLATIGLIIFAIVA